MEKITALLNNGWDGFGIYVVSFVVVLSLLVFVHEFGHYIVAKWCGVKITTFSIGFGKEICGWNDKSGTRWRIAMIPLGGYVQMFGDGDPSSSTKDKAVKELTAAEKKVSFPHKALWQRALIVFAGPAINFIFAALLLFGLFAFVGQPVTPPVASGVVVGSAAYKAGMLPHDRIIDINGTKIERFEDIQREVMIALDTKLKITLERGDEVIVLDNVYPERLEIEDRFGFKQSKGVLGLTGPINGLDLKAVVSVDGQAVTQENTAALLVSRSMGTPFVIETKQGEKTNALLVDPDVNGQTVENKEEDVLVLYDLKDEETFIKHSIPSAFVKSIEETGRTISNIFESLKQIITGVRNANELGGILRIGAIAGSAAAAGWVSIIGFTALLSINLGLINLFPIPVLDGGHLVFYAIEAVKGSPVSEVMQDYAYKAGFFLLIGLMVFANFNDLIQLFL